MIFIQIILFIYHAYYEKKLSDAPWILIAGAFSGIVPGLLCDLIFGKYLGLASYALGFGPFFLIINALCGYGIFAANILLMQRVRILHFFIWTMIVTAIFEITNLYVHVYTYSFAVPSTEYWIVAFVGPFIMAIIIALAWHKLFTYRFAFISNAAH